MVQPSTQAKVPVNRTQSEYFHCDRLPERALMKSLSFFILAVGTLAIPPLAQDKHDPPNAGPEEGFGRVHMEVSSSPKVSADFDRALALLHNFWYVRAFERFNEISKKDPSCAMAYWGAAMT